jgi:hypothetical protein
MLPVKKIAASDDVYRMSIPEKHADAIMLALQRMGTYGAGEDACDPATSVRRIPGDHPRMRIRGFPVRRSTLMLQTERLDGGYRKYAFFGWNWEHAALTRDVSDVPAIRRTLEDLNARCHVVKWRFNHVTCTFFRGRDEYKAYHGNKRRGLDPDSWVVMLWVGSPRLASVRLKGRDVIHEVFRSGQGLMVRVSSEHFEDMMYALPKVPKKGNGRGGQCVTEGAFVVLRSVSETTPWPAEWKGGSRKRRREPDTHRLYRSPLPSPLRQQHALLRNLALLQSGLRCGVLGDPLRSVLEFAVRARVLGLATDAWVRSVQEALGCTARVGRTVIDRLAAPNVHSDAIANVLHALRVWTRSRRRVADRRELYMRLA